MRDRLPLNPDLHLEETWDELYCMLRPVVRQQMRYHVLASWRGQEEDLVEDVIQETIVRAYERFQKAERGEKEPIYVLRHMVITIASNYWKDLRRRDYRLIPLNESNQVATVTSGGEDNAASFTEVATENVYRNALFKLLAREIVCFPPKQRRAFLIDMANRMSFEKQPTPLQQAFLDVGIQLQLYKQREPVSLKERTRHTVLLYLAYKRLRGLPSLRNYILQ